MCRHRAASTRVFTNWSLGVCPYHRYTTSPGARLAGGVKVGAVAAVVRDLPDGVAAVVLLGSAQL
jgi:hypothetical protein